MHERLLQASSSPIPRIRNGLLGQVLRLPLIGLFASDTQGRDWKTFIS